MLKDIIAVCPVCGKETTLAVSAPDPNTPADKRMSITVCRKCREKILVVTEPDGTISLARFDMEEEKSEPVKTETTIDSAFGFSDIVSIPFSLWQPRGELVDKFQHRPEWANALQDALTDTQNKPRPLSVPRRIFISYKWGSASEDDWVETLFMELQARGNQVIFDRHEMTERPGTVPELVARIAGCHYFLAILDPGYIERVSTDKSMRDEGWVTDEYHTALAFAQNGVITLIGMLRKGNRLPAAFREFAHGQPGNTFDVRQPDALIKVLDRFFVQFGSAPDHSTAMKAATLLHESQQTFDKGDAQTALEIASEACLLIPDLADGYAQRARMFYRIGQPEQALADARHAFDIDPTLDEMLVYAAAAANDLKKWQEGASFARLALERNRSQRNAHFLIGQALNEMDQVEAAISHFKLARKYKFSLSSLFNNAGFAFRRLGDPLEGLQWYKEGLQYEPDDVYLRANATAAAMEANDPIQAYQLVESLMQKYPDFPDIPFLASTLAKWCQEPEGGPPPVLTDRIERRNMVGTVKCTNCDAVVSLEDEKQMLCFGCGAVLSPSIDPCRYCGSDGKVIIASINSSCPFCAKGSLKYLPSN